ncbi:7040_t:CDS:2 [Racocetra persica]|uniref:7040_t:CDS:1 n=1 Tax=Racocetra persica TaxID=160502 RepID=A0ACA9KDE3_9GLOM|nr:7040_t:CDS:2 [Racocetra persica]
MEDLESNELGERTETAATEESDSISYTNKKNKRGRPRNPLWDSHFTEINTQESGHKGWRCNYCKEENVRATEINMNTHLALICKTVPLNIKQDCLRNFPTPNKKRQIEHDIASGLQPRIDSKFQNISKMDSGQEQLCHKALTRLFVCCGIPFWIVENPFFLDFCKNLCCSYKPPDRKALSNDWLNYETARIVVSMEKELENEKKSYTSWTSNRGYSYFAFIIITPDKKQYVHYIKDFSHESHTVIFTADEIEKVLLDIGANKFGAVISDGASAMSLAKQYISDKYPGILPVRCIAHHIQLICSDIICKTSFGKKVLQQCQLFVTYFHTSHRSGARLRNEMINAMINKGLKSSVCSRWSSAYDCILDNDEFAMTAELRNLTQDRQFWANAETLAKVLSPAKNAVKIVESKVTTTADIFLFLFQMAIAINSLKKNDLPERVEFRKQCIQFYNKRWKEFDIKFYILAYFLHLKYRGKGMRSSVFHQVVYTALEIWKKIGGGLASANILIAQIKMYDAFEPPYNFTFMENIESPRTWWNGCKISNHYLQKLDLHLLAITPHNASCERIFSILSWITQKRRSRITVEKVSNIAKLHTYYITNTQNYINHNVSESEFEQVMENYANTVEFDDDMFSDNFKSEHEEFDTDYVSDTEELADLLQFDNENLDIENMLDFNVFSERNENETTDTGNVEPEDEHDYDIEDVINASLSKKM